MREIEKTSRKIGDGYVWTEKSRRAFFTKANPQARGLLEAWSRESLGAIGRIGAINHILTAAPTKITSAEEWLDYYFDSGKARSAEWKEILKKKGKHDVDTNTKKRINADYGRTEVQMRDSVIALYSRAKAGKIAGVNAKEITYEMCLNLYINKIADAALLGCRREECAEKYFSENEKLRALGITIKQTSSKVDVREGVDFEVFNKHGEILVGLQVKGVNFKSFGKETEEEKKQKAHLEEQHRHYEALTKAPVHLCYIRQSKSKFTVNNVAFLVHAIIAANTRRDKTLDSIIAKELDKSLACASSSTKTKKHMEVR